MTIAFAGHRLDRADHVRADQDRLAELRRGDALLLDLDGLAPQLDDEDGLRWRLVADCAADAELVFLGLLDGRAAFAAVPAQGDGNPAPMQSATWDAIARMGAVDLATYGGARSLVDWHARHRFCAVCGTPTTIAKGGWQRSCGSCKAQHFPRVDPVAIMLVEHEGSLLLGRNTRFPPRRYSALAGFIEPGETIEEAVAREVFEEAGVRVRDVTYISSQPWPFPSQLMIGCHGFADDPTVTIDKTELDDARWFSREEVAEALLLGEDSPTFIPPRSVAIARHLLEHWMRQ